MFEISVASAVVAFNDGAAGSLKIMDKIGLHIGHFNLKSSLCSDLKRISTANYKSSTPVKSKGCFVMLLRKVMIKVQTRILVLGCFGLLLWFILLITFTFIYYFVTF